jgi:hypothetical protein
MPEKSFELSFLSTPVNLDAKSRLGAFPGAMALSYYAEETNPMLVFEAQRWMTEILAACAST